MPNIRKIFESLMDIRMYSVETVSKGGIDSNYIVNSIYFLRVKNKQYIPFYNPKVEQMIIKDVKPYHIDISPKAMDKKGNRVTIFEPLAKNFDPKRYTLKEIKAVARALRTLHHVPTKIEKRFDYVKRLRHYQSNSFATITNNRLNDKVMALCDKYFNDYSNECLCHNDLSPSNIVFIEDEVRLIDYEFGALNDPYFDLASFISDSNITDPQMIRVFLNEYFGKTVDDEVLEKVSDFILLQDYLWYFWGLYMHRITKDYRYQDIANIKRIRSLNPMLSLNK